MIMSTWQRRLEPGLVRVPYLKGELGFPSPGVELSQVLPMSGSERCRWDKEEADGVGRGEKGRENYLD